LTTTRTELVDDNDQEVQIDQMPLDVDGKAYVPGTALKGVLRSYLRRRYEVASDTLAGLLGSEDPSAPDARAGKAEFWDARVRIDAQHPLPANVLAPFWDAKRVTAVAAAVAIDRRTRTADHGKLFYLEFVPPEVSFHVTIVGQGCSPKEMTLLFAALQGFEDELDPVVIGARTHDGWGRFRWEPESLRKMDKEQVQAWWKNQETTVGYNQLDDAGNLRRATVQDLDLEEYRGRARSTYDATSSARSHITVCVELQFDDGFLVRDHGTPRKKKSAAQQNSDQPDNRPLRSANGRILLPARSIRGALRSQAERILRTIYPSDPTKIALIESIFGKTEHRAAIEFTDFHSPDSRHLVQRREFVAIDRFTGGSAESLKFNADVAVKPVLKGDVILNLDRLRSANGDAAQAIGLLALVLRDLCEGDITFGLGAAKGFGHCRATIVSGCATILEHESASLAEPLRRAGLSVTNYKLPSPVNHEELSRLDRFLDSCLDALRGPTKLKTAVPGVTP
jgi:CRISPR/Cas system CSM-associated protein Csm3 (group 7 of RAMP superfamily)